VVNGKVLIIGAAGFLGRHVVNALIDVGARVVCLDPANPNEIRDGQQWVTGRIEDKDTVRAAARGCEIVICLSGATLPGSKILSLGTEIASSVIASVEAAEVCGQMGANLFVFASSGGTVYGVDSAVPIPETTSCRPRNAYGVSKLATEHYLRILHSLHGLRTVSLRISNPYGEGQIAARGQGFIAAAMQAAMEGYPIPIWGDGSVVRDFIYVEDVAKAFVAACRYSGPYSEFNIGSGTGVSLEVVLNRIADALSRPVLRAYERSRAVDVAANVLDVARARDELNWRPSVGLKEGIENTARWWRDRGQQ
jgi:UDP-glucose 4-epimerase